MDDAQRLSSGEAWADFCDALKAAGQHVLAGPGDRAAGFRYLATLTAAGIHHVFDLADPDVPRFVRNPDSRSKWGAENADNLYLLAKIRSDRDYRIRGRRNSAFAFLLEIKEGYMQLGRLRNFATLDSADLEVEPDGSFEIVLSAEEQPGNWVPLHPDATQVLIRQYFCDWDREEPAEFRIVQVGNEGRPPATPDAAAVARLLDDSGQWVEASARVWNEWVARLRAVRADDSIAPARGYAGGADAIRYGNDVYRLGEDEALILELAPPKARYWSFQLVDLWFQSLDYTNRQSSLNQHQIRVDADGRARIVVAHRDPGVPNWLDTAGHTEGLVQYRYVWTQDSPQPSARVVPFDAVRRELPSDTPEVTLESRRDAIRRRQDHVARRERPC